MDTSLSNFATSSLVSSIGGARSWRQLIPSYSNRLYNKVSCTIGRLTPVSGYKKTGSVSKSWTAYGASRSFNKKGDNLLYTGTPPAIRIFHGDIRKVLRKTLMFLLLHVSALLSV